MLFLILIQFLFERDLLIVQLLKCNYLRNKYKVCFSTLTQLSSPRPVSIQG